MIDPMSRDIYGNTALHHAVLNGPFLIEKLKRPPDIIMPSDLNLTLLQLASYCDPGITQYLQKHSVVPYIRTAISMMKQIGLLK